LAGLLCTKLLEFGTVPRLTGPLVATVTDPDEEKEDD
jgi:hypothetical protein